MECDAWVSLAGSGSLPDMTWDSWSPAGWWIPEPPCGVGLCPNCAADGEARGRWLLGWALFGPWLIRLKRTKEPRLEDAVPVRP